MLNYDLAHMIQEEYRQEVAAGRLIAKVERGVRRPRRIVALETLRQTRHRLGVALIRLGLSLAGRDAPADVGSTP